MLLNLLVGLNRDAGTSFFHVSALVNQLRDGLSAWISVGDVGLNESEHLDGGFVQLYEDTIVELSESQQGQHFSWLGMDSIDTILINRHKQYPLILTTKATLASGGTK